MSNKSDSLHSVSLSEIEPVKNNDRAQMIIRQVENKIAHMDPALKSAKQIDDVSNQISFSELISVATRQEMCYMYAGWFFSALTGIGMPIWAVLMGDLFDGFGPTQDPDEAFETIKELCLIITLVGVAIWITAFV